jgi:hypothetical protein
MTILYFLATEPWAMCLAVAITSLVMAAKA